LVGKSSIDTIHPGATYSLSLTMNFPNLSVFRTHEISKCLWFAFIVVHPVPMRIMAVVIVAMGIFCGTNVLHL
jgi:hypothetical protein